MLNAEERKALYAEAFSLMAEAQRLLFEARIKHELAVK
jgi:hypothetical protein